LKANKKNCTNTSLAKGPLKTLEARVFRERRQLETQDFYAQTGEDNGMRPVVKIFEKTSRSRAKP